MFLDGQPDEQTAWMSHGDSVVRAPEGFEVLASSDATPVAAFASDERKLYGVQWHPEVKHSAHGQAVLENFLHRAAGIPADWNSGNVIAEQVETHPRAGRHGPRDLRALGRRRLGGRGGARAPGGRRPAGLRLRRPRPAAGRGARAGRAGLRRRHRRAARHGRRARAVPRRARRGDRPRGEAQDHRARVHPHLRGRRRPSWSPSSRPRATRSGSSCRARCTRMSWRAAAEPAPPTSRATTTSAGCPTTSQFELVEPLRTLFKDEVRAIGRELGLPEVIVGASAVPRPRPRHPDRRRGHPRAARAAARRPTRSCGPS